MAWDEFLILMFAALGAAIMVSAIAFVLNL